MSQLPYIEAPTYEAGAWTTTVFPKRTDFRDFIRSIFKDAGPDEGYKFTLSISRTFNAEANRYNILGYYSNAPLKTKDYIAYWDTQKLRCRKGAIYKENGMTWYLPRDYYMWLNFLPIYDKEEKAFGFAKVRDAQYHIALYECLAELSYRHVALLKKRQIASSYFHMAKLINQYYFEEGRVLKMGASLKDYISEKGDWRMLNEYRNFLNEHTAWYRPSEPDKVFSWQQRIKVRIGGRDMYRGNKSIITGTSFEKDPTNGVGGPCDIFYHEELGIAPRAMDTYEFMRPALQSGMVTTGLFIGAGSVGDLTQCLPLKEMMLYPRRYDMLPITTALIDKKGTVGESALFIPEQWSMPPYIDEAGNSMVKEAIAAIVQQRLQWKIDLSPEQYQLRISQHPMNIEEAFATRKESVFPSHLVAAQKQRIEDKTYAIEYLELSRDAEGKIIDKPSRKTPIMKWPMASEQEDKEGVLCIYERPCKNPEFGMYYGSVDPVGEGKTTTSKSLCAIYIYKCPVEVITDDLQGTVNHTIERGGMVASWCGRFDDIKNTHERLELLIEWYNAWTLVENNVALFIQYMISQKKQRYLVPKNMILFLKDIGANTNVFQEYGWKNVGTIFKGNLLSYGVESLSEVLDQETAVDGTILKKIYGVERVKDIMLLVEMSGYQDGVNVDRLVAYCALVAFVSIQQSNRGMAKRVELVNQKLENSKKFSRLNSSPFRHVGMQNAGSLAQKPSRNPFRHFR